MRRLRRRRRAPTATELEITPFLGLMVVLVPFLLLSAVFSQIAVLELRLAGAPAAADAGPGLELTVRRTALVLRATPDGAEARFPRRPAGYDLAALGERLAAYKRRHPALREITLLVAPEIDYQTLIDVMDTVRIGAPGGPRVPLFPDVALAEAPPEAGP